MYDDMTVQEFYRREEGRRSSWLQRSQDICAEVLPTFYGDEWKCTRGRNNSRKYTNEPDSSVPGQLVEGLVNKVVFGIAPPTEPTVRYQMDPIEAQIAAEFVVQAKLSAGELDPQEIDIGDEIAAETARLQSDVEEKFITREQSARAEFNRLRLRAFLRRAVQHVFYGGQGLMYVPMDPSDDNCRIWGMDQLVTKRDASGKCFRWATVEMYHPGALPEDIRKVVEEARAQDEEAEEDDLVEVYYQGKLRDGTLYVCMEVEGEKVWEEEYPEDESPFFLFGGDGYLGTDYRRPFLDTYYREIVEYNGLRAALNKRAGIAGLMSKVMVRKGKGLNMRRFLNSDTFAVGDPGDIFVPEGGGMSDFQLLQVMEQDLLRHLSQALLYVPSSIRNSERTTATEVELTKQELELSTLGSLLGNFIDEFIIPLYRILEKRIQKRHGDSLPELPEGVIPTVVTGLEALGRAIEGSRLATTMQTIKGIAPDTAIYNQRFASSMLQSAGHNARRYVPSEESVARAQRAQMAQEQEMQALGRAAQEDMRTPQEGA